MKVVLKVISAATTCGTDETITVLRGAKGALAVLASALDPCGTLQEDEAIDLSLAADAIERSLNAIDEADAWFPHLTEARGLIGMLGSALVNFPDSRPERRPSNDDFTSTADMIVERLDRALAAYAKQQAVKEAEAEHV